MVVSKIVHIYDIIGYIKGIEGEVTFIRTASSKEEVEERIQREYPKLVITEIKDYDESE